jgi:hypothetical protein
MRVETAWIKDATLVRDFQIGTAWMWERWRNGGWDGASGPDLQRRPQVGTRDAQGGISGWVEIASPAAVGAAIAGGGFPRWWDEGRGLQ